MDSTQDNSAGEPRSDSYTGAGFLLRSAREEQGLSLADMATRTRIPLRQLEVIEAGAFETLPSRTYAVGFARTYARAIGLDEQAILEAVRSELGDSSEPRTPVSSAMEPGDPAKLPSRGLAWAAAIGALLLALGLFAWFGSRYGAGEGPDPLPVEATETDAGDPEPAATDAAAPAQDARVVTFTALEDNIWVRLYAEGGERLLEKTLVRGESFTIPAAVSDPRLSTGRPDALGITIDGQPVAKLAERPRNIGGEPVSAAALLARPGSAAAPTPVPGLDSATGTANAPPRRPAAAPRARSADPVVTTLPETGEPDAEPAPPPPTDDRAT